MSKLYGSISFQIFHCRNLDGPRVKRSRMDGGDLLKNITAATAPPTSTFFPAGKFFKNLIPWELMWKVDTISNFDVPVVKLSNTSCHP